MARTILESVMPLEKCYNLKERIAFLHLPKTGGSYVCSLNHDTGTKKEMHEDSSQDSKALVEPHGNTFRFLDMGHSTFGLWDIHGHQKRHAIRDAQVSEVKKGGYTVFSIVRNPFSWLLSMYDDDWGSYAKDWRTGKKVKFKQYVEDFFLCRRAWSHHSNRFYNRFIFYAMFNEAGKSCVDFVIRQESLDKSINEIYTRFNFQGKHTPRSRVNYSTDRYLGNDYRSYYDSEMIEWVKERCGEELRIFNYGFDGPLDKHMLLKSSHLQFSSSNLDNKIIQG